jgi:UPF0755 protein
MTEDKKRKHPHVSIWLLSVIAAVAFVMYIMYEATFAPNTGPLQKGPFFYVHTGYNYDSVVRDLETGGYIKDMRTFKFLSNRLGLPSNIHPGKYKINKGMSNYDIIRLLRSGRQTPIKLVVKKVRSKNQIISFLGKNLEADSSTIVNLFNDSDYLAQFGLDTGNVLGAIMPDTYEFFWATSADKAFRKIVKNYQNYWTVERKLKAQELGLTPAEVMIVASIVDEETNKASDKGKVASVYLNRLKDGMKLQADPTVRYAIGDFTIHRVTGPMLKYDSPYNTYKYKGLPPGPICTPEKSSIEAVLNAPKTDYKYFCASPALNGSTDFACTFEEQKKNARQYQRTLDKKGIH